MGSPPSSLLALHGPFLSSNLLMNEKEALALVLLDEIRVLRG